MRRALLKRFEAHSSQLAVSAISYAELSFGVAHSSRVKQNRIELDVFVQALEILPFDAQCGSEYGLIRQALALKGEMIGGNDLLIAAHARHLKATLVTNNTRAFKRVPKLVVENWLI